MKKRGEIMHKEHLVIELPKGTVLEGTIKGADASGYVTVRATEDGLKIVTDSLELCRTAGPAVQFKPWDQTDVIKPRRFGQTTSVTQAPASTFQSSILDMLASEGDTPDAAPSDLTALEGATVAQLAHSESDEHGMVFDEGPADVQFAEDSNEMVDAADDDLFGQPVAADYTPDEDEIDEIEGQEYEDIPN